LCEVLERDAFSIVWQAMVSPPRIDLTTISDSNRAIVERFRAARCEVTLFDLSLDIGIPVVMAVQRSSQAPAPLLTFAASCDPDPEIAVRDALEELAHTMRYMLHISTYEPRLEHDPSFSNVLDQDTHLNFWCDGRWTDGADFIWGSDQARKFQDLEDFSAGGAGERLRRLVDRVAERTGCRVLAADVTSDDVRELGLAVVRIVVPGLHPLFWNHRYRSLGGTRLWTVPQKLGYRGIDRAAGDNPLPHPYP
jgi:ribosomal protein S12 methylthiotransferase accessory factor